LTAGTILTCLLVAEMSVRYLGHTDLDGNFIIYGRALKSYHLPVKTMRQKAEVYQTSTRTRIMYDPQLGWTNRPSNQSADGLYAYNALGARIAPAAPIEYTQSPLPDTLRIVIVGDSYTHGDEVSFENTWGYYLQQNLNEAGINAEVINLAVGAYGLDQAFLRWQNLGRNLSPDIVILGLQMENIQRNVNLIKPIYQPNTGLPFTKPRYILSDDGLALINTPAVPPEQIAGLLENITAWELAPHEYFFKPEDYQKQLWRQSKLVALTQEILWPVETDPFFYDLNEEPARLTLSIIETFKSEGEANGSDFLIVHIPIVLDLINLSLNREPVYTDLLAAIEAENVVIHTQDALLKETGTSSLFSLFKPAGHYTAKGNEVIAEMIAKHILLMRQFSRCEARLRADCEARRTWACCDFSNLDLLRIAIAR
jgi:hypothetical protein